MIISGCRDAFEKDLRVFSFKLNVVFRRCIEGWHAVSDSLLFWPQEQRLKKNTLSNRGLPLRARKNCCKLPLPNWIPLDTCPKLVIALEPLYLSLNTGNALFSLSLRPRLSPFRFQDVVVSGLCQLVLISTFYLAWHYQGDM